MLAGSADDAVSTGNKYAMQKTFEGRLCLVCCFSYREGRYEGSDRKNISDVVFGFVSMIVLFICVLLCWHETDFGVITI